METIRRTSHPRPDRQREHWMTLNGAWRFAFDWKSEGTRQRWYENGDFPLTIQVPFAYQSALSGIRETGHCPVVWYSRNFTVPETMSDQRVLLHFGAADYQADVWLDGQYLGSHEGGYTPFSFELTDLVQPGGSYRLTVRCRDELDPRQPRGKQSWRQEPFACWYTPVTGLWQSVWLEGVGQYYPVDFRLTPNVEKASLNVEITLNEEAENACVRLTARLGEETVARQETAFCHGRDARITLPLTHDFSRSWLRLWTPDNPQLYDLTIETLADGRVCDLVETYFGMRSIRVEGDKIYLNGVQLYQRLVLDQGYWPDGLLTAPSDEALRRDVELTKALGFNGARKHQKFEDPQYYYWADRLGLLVWSELPSAYTFCDREKRSLMRDLSEGIARDYNHPSIIAWTPLNESWGVPNIRREKEDQETAAALYAIAHALDGTRFVSGNDGWHQAATDVVTVHDYTAWPEDMSPNYQNPEKMLTDGVIGDPIQALGWDLRGKPMLLTEYGGIAMQKDAGGGNWGYHGMAADEESFLKRYSAITAAIRKIPCMKGYCYTQLTDVFQEVNGLLDMERRPKASIEAIRKINAPE